MAKKFSMGALIAVGAAAAAIGGGVAAYLNRETLKQVVNDISEKIAANKEEEDLFLEFEEEPRMRISSESKDLCFFSKEELKDIEIAVTHADIVEELFLNR